MATIKLEKTIYDYIILDATTKIKVINSYEGQKMVLLEFNNHIYMIDDTHNQQNVVVFSKHCDGEIEEVVKKM